MYFYSRAWRTITKYFEYVWEKLYLDHAERSDLLEPHYTPFRNAWSFVGLGMNWLINISSWWILATFVVSELKNLHKLPQSLWQFQKSRKQGFKWFWASHCFSWGNPHFLLCTTFHMENPWFLLPAKSSGEQKEGITNHYESVWFTKQFPSSYWFVIECPSLVIVLIFEIKY